MQTGDSFCYTNNRELAAALATLDIPFLEGGAYMYRVNKDGKESVVWNFASVSRDGTVSTSDMITCYSKGDEWFDKNPFHPLTIAIHAQRNLATLEKLIEEDMPFASFDLGGGKQLHARLGSDEHSEAVAAGLKQL